MGNLGATELLIIGFVIVLLFGSKKLPDMARSLGRSAKILKAETSGIRTEDEPTSPAAVADTGQATQVERMQQQIDDLQRQLRQSQQSQPPQTG